MSFHPCLNHQSHLSTLIPLPFNALAKTSFNFISVLHSVLFMTIAYGFLFPRHYSWGLCLADIYCALTSQRVSGSSFMWPQKIQRVPFVADVAIFSSFFFSLPWQMTEDRDLPFLSFTLFLGLPHWSAYCLNMFVAERNKHDVKLSMVRHEVFHLTPFRLSHGYCNPNGHC